MDGYYAWMIIATAMVLLMTVPGLALFYGGMTRSKSVLNMMMMSFVGFAVVGIIFVLWGWSEGWNSIGNGELIANPFTLFGLHDVAWDSYIGVLFQLTFAAITAALISGALADRVKLSSWIVFVGVWVTLCYFPVAHNVWGGGWLSQHFPALDYAGGTVVHINAGVAAGVAALIIGPRIGFRRDVMRPHNLTLTMIGAGLLWFGWYGFNVGSIVFAAGDGGNKDTAQFMSETGVTFMNTTIATMAAMLGWLLMERIVHGKATSLGAASGIVAGLVAITPSCGSVNLLGAIIVGGVAGLVCAWAVGLKYRFGLDDSLDVVGVHLVGGIVGTLLIGFVGTRTSPQGVDGFFPAGANGIFYGGDATLLGHQAAAVLFTLVWTGVLTAAISLAIKHTMGWRIQPTEEIDGIDSAQHGERAYDLDGRGGGSVLGATAGVPAPAATNEGAMA